MTEQNQTPAPQWVTELKEWGIDVEVFDARWEQAGADAKAQFQQALMDAKAAYETGKSELKATMDEAHQDAEAFVQKMNSAWDEMASGIMQELRTDTPGSEASGSEFLELFDMEIQNRAFALRSAREVVARASATEDVTWHETWLAFERFNQGRYAPFAKKYGLSQEPRAAAKIQAGLANMAGKILPDNVTMGFMLEETIKYLEKLKELATVAPEEDHAFFSYVVEQEEMQIDALRLRTEGKSEESAELIRQFIAKHSN
ncbi:MAG: hypothetical protein AAFV33_10800 [Chloroflexota bacterium]